MAVASEGHAIHILDPACDGAAVKMVGHKSGVTSVDWCPASEFVLASGSLDGSVKLWDIRCGGSRSQLASFDWRQENLEMIDTARAHEGAVMCVKYTAWGDFLVTTGNDRTLRLWSAAPGSKNVGAMKKQTHAGCFSRLPYQILLCTSSGSSIADTVMVPDDSGLVSIFDLHGTTSAGAVHSLKGHVTGMPVTGLAWRQPSQEVITAARDGLILSWASTPEDGSESDERTAEIKHDDWSDDDELQGAVGTQIQNIFYAAYKIMMREIYFCIFVSMIGTSGSEEEMFHFLPPILRQILGRGSSASSSSSSR